MFRWERCCQDWNGAVAIEIGPASHECHFSQIKRLQFSLWFRPVSFRNIFVCFSFVRLPRVSLHDYQAGHYDSSSPWSSSPTVLIEHGNTNISSRKAPSLACSLLVSFLLLHSSCVSCHELEIAKQANLLESTQRLATYFLG